MGEKMTEALVSPQMLRWARERAGISLDVLASRLNVKIDKLANWEAGRTRPTFKQAEKIAQKLYIPFGFLFLDDPPAETLPLPDLRRLPDLRHLDAGGNQSQTSQDFRDLIGDVLFQQDWYREYLLENHAEELPFVGKFSLGTPVKEVSEDIRLTLGLDDTFSQQGGTWESALRTLFDLCEAAGIWVMRRGYVGSNTRRTLDVAEFRGFAVSDPLAPLIFINGRDAKAAQAFTLAHELAHIWLGESGISNPSLKEDNENQMEIERRCNAIAAEFLVPEEKFLGLWSGNKSLEENTQSLSPHFKVSKIVIARRALDLKMIDRNQYNKFFENEKILWQKDKPSDGGGDYFKMAPIMNGKQFTKTVLSSAMSGDLLLRDAGHLLHMKPDTVVNLYKRQYRGRNDLSS